MTAPLMTAPLMTPRLPVAHAAAVRIAREKSLTEGGTLFEGLRNIKKLYHVIGAPTSYAELRRLVIRALRLAPPA